MSTIKKKITPEYFNFVASGKKNFEVRLADFDIKEGDILALEEWDPETKQYTGKKIEKEATYIYKFNLNDFGQAEQIKKDGLFVIRLD